MNHPKRYVRDTQKYPGYRQLVKGRRPGLKMLAKRILGINIQSGEHSSVGWYHWSLPCWQCILSPYLTVFIIRLNDIASQYLLGVEKIVCKITGICFPYMLSDISAPKLTFKFFVNSLNCCCELSGLTQTISYKNVSVHTIIFGRFVMFANVKYLYYQYVSNWVITMLPLTHW